MQYSLPNLWDAVFFATYLHPVVLQDEVFSCWRLHGSHSGVKLNALGGGEVNALHKMAPENLMNIHAMGQNSLLLGKVE